MRVFPVQAVTRYASRFAPGEHEGVDLFADGGSPVVAVAAGQVRRAEEPKGGRVVYLTEPDGTQYYYSHLEGWEGEFPRKVQPGEPLGRVGNTGNAAGAPPHVHFEIRPGGGAKVDPVPLLERINSAAPIEPVVEEGKSGARRMSGMGLVGLLALWWLARGRDA